MGDELVRLSVIGFGGCSGRNELLIMTVGVQACCARLRDAGPCPSPLSSYGRGFADLLGAQSFLMT